MFYNEVLTHPTGTMKNKINQAIGALGERFNFDAHYFTKNTFWLLVGQGMMSLAAFVSTVVLANYVSKQGIGDYRLIISIYAIVTFFSLPGIGVALIHSVVNGKDGSLQEAMAIKKSYSLLAFAVSVAIAIYFGIFRQNLLLGIGVFIMGACLPIIETYSLYIAYLQGVHEFKYSSFNTGIVKIISSIAVITAVFVYPIALYLVAAFYISQAIAIYWQYKIFIKKFPPKNNSKDDQMLPYAKHLTYASTISLFFGQADKFILYHFFGPIALAQYWIASTLPQEVSRVISTASQVIYPKFIKGNHEEMKKWLPKKLLQVTVVLLGISMLYAFIAYPFFHIFFPQYIDQVGKSIVLMFASVVVPYTFVWVFYTAKRNVKVTYISNIFDPVLQVVLYIVLIPLYGVWGLVSAIFIKMLIMNIFAWFVLKFY